MRPCADVATTRRFPAWPARALACALTLVAAAALLASAAAARAPLLPIAAAETSTVPALDEAEAVRASQAAVGRSVPDLVLLDRAGRPVRLAGYRGKPLLVSFIYTGCFQVCPTQTRALHEAVRGLDTMLGAHQFNVISIGFNQPFDSPVAMRAFAAQQGITAPNWEFLSPPRAAVDELTRAFGFRYVATPAGFDHVLGVTVVDADGRIHAQVLGDRVRADRLGEPLRALLKAAPLPGQGRLEAVIEQVRILCTVYDPDTGRYRYDNKLILELIGGAVFFVAVFGYLIGEWRSQRRARARPCQPTSASGSTA